MSKVAQDIKKLKRRFNEFPSTDKIGNLLQDIEQLQIQMHGLLEERKTAILKTQERLFPNLPTDGQLNQAVADIISDKSNWADVEALLNSEGINAPLDEVMEFMKIPLKKKYKKEMDALVRAVYKKLNKDLNIIKDSQVDVRQNRAGKSDDKRKMKVEI